MGHFAPPVRHNAYGCGSPTPYVMDVVSLDASKGHGLIQPKRSMEGSSWLGEPFQPVGLPMATFCPYSNPMPQSMPPNVVQTLHPQHHAQSLSGLHEQQNCRGTTGGELWEPAWAQNSNGAGPLSQGFGCVASNGFFSGSVGEAGEAARGRLGTGLAGGESGSMRTPTAVIRGRSLEGPLGPPQGVVLPPQSSRSVVPMVQSNFVPSASRFYSYTPAAEAVANGRANGTLGTQQAPPGSFRFFEGLRRPVRGRLLGASSAKEGDDRLLASSRNLRGMSPQPLEGLASAPSASSRCEAVAPLSAIRGSRATQQVTSAYSGVSASCMQPPSQSLRRLSPVGSGMATASTGERRDQSSSSRLPTAASSNATLSPSSLLESVCRGAQQEPISPRGSVAHPWLRSLSPPPLTQGFDAAASAAEITSPTGTAGASTEVHIAQAPPVTRYVLNDSGRVERHEDAPRQTTIPAAAASALAAIAAMKEARRNGLQNCIQVEVTAKRVAESGKS